MPDDYVSTDLASASYLAERDMLPDWEDRPEDEDSSWGVGWERCGVCGARSPHPYCPEGHRVRPPRSAGEVRWMVWRGVLPTARDFRAFPNWLDDPVVMPATRRVLRDRVRALEANRGV